MRQIIHITIIILVMFSIGIEAYKHLYNSFGILNYPSTSIGRLVFYFSYFTILSNLAVAVSSFLLLRKPDYDSGFFRILRLDGLICIIITAVVYNVVLRKTHPTFGIMGLTNEFLHVIIPVLAIFTWLVYDPHPRVDKKTILLSIIPPLFYILYIFIRGEITQLYPYPFLNAGKIGLAQALLNTGVVVVVFILFEGILYFIDRRLSKRQAN